MPRHLHEKAIIGLMEQGPEARYYTFVSSVASSKECWLIEMPGKGLVLWCHPRFAQLWQEHEQGNNYTIIHSDLEFLLDTILLRYFGRQVIVFPTPAEPDSPSIAANELRADLVDYFEEAFGANWERKELEDYSETQLRLRGNAGPKPKLPG